MSSYNIEQFSFNIDEYAAELTIQSQQTLYWLNRNGYLNNQDTENLLGRMVVTPIRNRPRLGQRLLSRFFNKKSTENSYVFPITIVDDINVVNTTKDDKPNLTVVK